MRSKYLNDRSIQCSELLSCHSLVSTLTDKAMRSLIAVCVLTLSGCGDWPEIDIPATGNGAEDEWPQLLPLDEIAGASTGELAMQNANDVLLSRAEALRARASLLRSVDDLTQLRDRLAR